MNEEVVNRAIQKLNDDFAKEVNDKAWEELKSAIEQEEEKVEKANVDAYIIDGRETAKLAEEHKPKVEPVEMEQVWEEIVTNDGLVRRQVWRPKNEGDSSGSRNIEDYRTVCLAILHSGMADEITEIVSGTARGVDMLGEKCAIEKGWKITRFKPDWSIGKKAGPLRNIDMAKYADALIALRLDKSRGTSHMIDTMINLEKPVYYCDFTTRSSEPVLVGTRSVNYEIKLIDGKRRYIGGLHKHRPVSSGTQSEPNV